MSERVLILDDDEDFNTLLTQVFTQGGFGVVSRKDPREALKLLQEEAFDIVISDHLMPTLSGLQFIHELRTFNKDIPIIIVSGHVQEDTIRLYIKEGICGLFLKPLNIFSLMRKTREVLKQGPGKFSNREDVLEVREGGSNSNIGFPFKSFPCLAPIAARFARNLYEARAFSKSLLLIGPAGTHFGAIAEDLVALSDVENEKLAVLDPEDEHSGDSLLKWMEEYAKRGVQRVTLLCMDITALKPEAAATLLSISRGSFLDESVTMEIRLLLCAHDLPDQLYASGDIDESIYMAAGLSEVMVPPLGEVSEDIPGITSQILIANDIREELLEDAMAYIVGQQWPGNYEQLENTLVFASELSSGETIGVSEIIAAHRFEGIHPFKALPSSLGRMLEDDSRGYARAVLALSGNDAGRAAEILGVSAERLGALTATGSETEPPSSN